MPLIHPCPGKVCVGPAWTAVSEHAVDRFLERFAPDCDKPHTFLYNLGKNARYFGETAGADVFVHDDTPGAIFLVRGITRTLVSIFDMPRSESSCDHRLGSTDKKSPAATEPKESESVKNKPDERLSNDGLIRRRAPHSPLRPSAYPVDKESSVAIKNLKKIVWHMTLLSSDPIALSTLRQKTLRKARAKVVLSLLPEDNAEPEAWSLIREDVMLSIFRHFLLPKENENKEGIQRIVSSISSKLVCVAHEDPSGSREEYLFVSSLGFLFYCVRLEFGEFSLEKVIPPLRASRDDYFHLMIAPSEVSRLTAAESIAKKEIPGKSVLSVYLDLSEDHLLALNSIDSPNPFHDMTSSDVRDAVRKMMLLRSESGDVLLKLRPMELDAGKLPVSKDGAA